MRTVYLENDVTLNFKKMRDAKDNVQYIAIQSVVEENLSEYIFFTLSKVRNRKAVSEYLDNLGLSEDEKSKVHRELVELLDSRCDVVINEIQQTAVVYEWLKGRIESIEVKGDDIVDEDGKICIKKDTFWQIVKGIEQYGHTAKTILKQLEADELLKSAKGRKDVQKRYKENGDRAEWVFCIKKEGKFKDVNIQRDKENTEEGGED